MCSAAAKPQARREAPEGRGAARPRKRAARIPPGRPAALERRPAASPKPLRVPAGAQEPAPRRHPAGHRRRPASRARRRCRSRRPSTPCSRVHSTRSRDRTPSRISRSSGRRSSTRSTGVRMGEVNPGVDSFKALDTTYVLKGRFDLGTLIQMGRRELQLQLRRCPRASLRGRKEGDPHSRRRAGSSTSTHRRPIPKRARSCRPPRRRSSVRRPRGRLLQRRRPREDRCLGERQLQPELGHDQGDLEGRKSAATTPGERWDQAKKALGARSELPADALPVEAPEARRHRPGHLRHGPPVELADGDDPAERAGDERLVGRIDVGEGEVADREPDSVLAAESITRPRVIPLKQTSRSTCTPSRRRRRRSSWSCSSRRNRRRRASAPRPRRPRSPAAARGSGAGGCAS